jgi:hypothetical protein
MKQMDKDANHISHFHEPLHEGDKSDITWGCRHTNPEICKNHSLYGKCAFVREDNICLIPPRSWKRQFERLLKNKK